MNHLKQYLVDPDKKLSLKDWDADKVPDDYKDKVFLESEIERLRQELDALQAVLYAQHKHRLLVVLQGMDTSGKDGTIRSVFEGVNPQGVRVVSFKAPTSDELDHDYLWRVHRQTPVKGEIVVFNRSHYEDVLVVRVHDLVPREIWKKRYGQIRAFEKILYDEGTTILKFFLLIDKDEQKKRLQERLKDSKKNWKFNPDDLKEREYWEDYSAAYEDVINKTSSDYAPWIIVPSNHKNYRNFVVAQYVVSALKKLDLEYPKQSVDVTSIFIE
jgi:PPK2 family polyphosphate:nucleotide phosphotransferase